MGALFDGIRQHVTAEDAARFYGLHVNSKHKALCPWHKDRHPSLSFNPRTGRCYCFACNHGGDAVDVTAVLLNVSTLEAARQITADFGLNIDDRPGNPSPIGETPAQAAQRERAALEAEYHEACTDLHNAQAALNRFTPANMTDPAFTKALNQLSKAQDAAEAALTTLNNGG